MADTIDRIQVEFSTNIQEFLTQLSGIEAGIDNVSRTFGTVESASVRYASAMDGTATATSSAVSSINEYTAAATTQADAAQTAAAETENQGRKSSEAFANVKEGLGVIRKMLGMFGVSIGIGVLISQVRELAKEAEAAGKAYGKMYNTIYYSIGELTASQQELARSLRLEGFDTTDVAEAVSRLTNLFPDAESTMLDDGTSVLSKMAEEVLWMDRKGYGDVSEIIDRMNDAFKKWSIPSTDITGELGYLAAAYRDTNTDVSTLLSSLTRLDEVGKTLGFTFRDMVDFIGAANVAGNLDDLSNVGMRFESQYTSRVSDLYNALLNADAETLTGAGLTGEEANSAIQQIVDELSVDETSARIKAQELAGTIVTAIFQSANREASVSATQAQASQIWADALDIEVSRITNRLADLSMSATKGYAGIRTTNRDIVTETGQTTTALVKVDKGLGTSDYTAANAAEWEKELSETWMSKQAPKIEKSINEYIQAGYGSMLSNYLGRQGPYIELKENVADAQALVNPVMAILEEISTSFHEWSLSAVFPKENIGPTAIDTWLAACSDQLDGIRQSLVSTGNEQPPDVTVESPDRTDTGQEETGTWDLILASIENLVQGISSFSPIGTAEAAGMVPIPELANVMGDLDATADGDVRISATGNIRIVAGTATLESGIEPVPIESAAMQMPPEITVSVPDILVNPTVSVYPEISVDPEITIEQNQQSPEEVSPLSTLLSTATTFFDRVLDNVESLDFTAEVPEQVSVSRSQPTSQEDTISPVFSVFESLLAAMDSGSTVFSRMISDLYASIETLSASIARNGNVTVIQYISAPVADSYTIRNAAAAGISAAQAKSFRL